MGLQLSDSSNRLSSLVFASLGQGNGRMFQNSFQSIELQAIGLQGLGVGQSVDKSPRTQTATNFLKKDTWVRISFKSLIVLVQGPHNFSISSLFEFIMSRLTILLNLLQLAETRQHDFHTDLTITHNNKKSFFGV